MDVPLIELASVKKSFGPVEVLKGIDFKAYAGRVTALVGDNGAGKSTLIKGLSGVQPFDEGTVKFEGEDVHITSARQSSALGIEVVYQDLALCEPPWELSTKLRWNLLPQRRCSPCLFAL